MELNNSTQKIEFKAPPQIQMDGYLYNKKDIMKTGNCYCCSIMKIFQINNCHNGTRNYI